MEVKPATWLNRSVLKWARERIGLSLEDVQTQSEGLGNYYTAIESKQLGQWEAGAAQPELEHLETLAQLYVCPVGYFFLKDIPRETIPLSFRGLSPEKQGKLKTLSQQTLHRFLELADWTTLLIEEEKLEWSTTLRPQTQLRGDISEVESLVQRERKRLGFTPDVRKKWTDPDDAFIWWRKRIEDRGVFCFQMKLEIGDIRGASIWFNSRYPFILVNHQDVESAAGRIFTLLHEYAHVISGGDGLVCDFRGLRSGEGPETFANRFAARMLLSYDDLQKRLRDIGKYGFSQTWSDNLLDEIRRPFSVSRDVVAIALQEMNLAPRDFYNNKRAQWEKKKVFGRGGGGGRPTNNELKLREIGYSLTRILSKPGKERSLPIDDVSSVLGMKVEKVPEFLSWARHEVHAEG
jgi:Zn-dependent peptidase ImmA (M78 family)/transcriptional regulator with XRE-family HTH domain